MSARQQLLDRYRRRGATEPVIDLREPDMDVDLRDGMVVGSRDADPAGVVTPLRSVPTRQDKQLRPIRFFGTPAFRRLWVSQVASSLGDWIGIVALTSLASTSAGGGIAGLSGVSLVLAARLIPGFFFSPFAGVLADRWDRKTIMVVTDFIRAAVLCGLALFVAQNFGAAANFTALVLASFLLELATLLWSPAKDASVPNLVPRSFLAKANSLGLAAAYGPLLIAGALFALLVQIPDWIGYTGVSDESVALYFDAITYMVSAAVIWTLVIPRGKTLAKSEKSGAAAGVSQAIDGLKYVASNTRVRSIMLGLSTALIGGAMVVPLGQQFADDALGAGKSGYGLLLTGMGIGVAVGVLVVSVLQSRLPLTVSFLTTIFGAGIALAVVASMTGVASAVTAVGVLGLCAGAGYVLSYSNIQIHTEDEMRGRVFATLYTCTRVCILLALVVAPLLAGVLDELTSIEGVRLTLWLGSGIILIAGVLAMFSFRERTPRTRG